MRIKHPTHRFRYAAITAVLFACLSFVGLAVSILNPRFFDTYFPFLLVLNILVTAALMLVVGTMCVRLTGNYVRNRFGSRLTAKLALMMALISVVPTIIVFAISTAFINRSMDNWFGIRVENALEAGVNITQGILARQQQSAQENAQHFAESLANTPPSLMMHELLSLLENHSGTEALVVTGTGSAVAAAGSRINVLLPDLPSAMQLKTAQTTGIYSVVDGDTLFEPPEGDNTVKSDLRVHVIVPIPSRQNDTESGLYSSSLLAPTQERQQLFLQLIQPIEENIALNAAKLVEGYRDYQQSAYTRDSMQTLYRLTLTLTLLIAVFASIAAALSFARRTSGPVLQLTKGTQQVINGDLVPIREFTGSDEITRLTTYFNTMIREVAEARQGLERQRRQAEQAQAFQERVLANISSGVLVVDQWNTVVTANLAAQRIIGENSAAVGSSLAETEPELVAAIADRHRELPNDTEVLTLEFELKREQKVIPLYLRSSPIPLGAQTGAVLVFNDVTQLIQAQRATAWGEVARRLAHEIKNPLTPIRLSAERLEWKLESKLTEEKDLALLHKTIATIVSQVDALKQMVNDFREYAKLPSADLRPMNLNDFLQSTISLYLDAGECIQTTLDPSVPMIDGDPNQLRQVLHNLVSNSIEASSAEGSTQISIRTQVIPTLSRSDLTGAVKLSITDNGSGFSSKILESAFEPYITTKPTGTGLGLPMVKRILDEHSASITLSNCIDPVDGHVTGARVEILFRASKHTKSAQQDFQHSEI